MLGSLVARAPGPLMLLYLLVFSVLLKIQTAATTSTTGSSCSRACRSGLLDLAPVGVAEPAREREPDQEGALPAPAGAALDGRDPARRLRCHDRDRRLLSLVYLPGSRATVWLSLPVAVLIVGFVSGFALAVASLNAIYRDVEHIVAALLRRGSS